MTGAVNPCVRVRGCGCRQVSTDAGDKSSGEMVISAGRHSLSCCRRPERLDLDEDDVKSTAAAVPLAATIAAARSVAATPAVAGDKAPVLPPPPPRGPATAPSSAPCSGRRRRRPVRRSPPPRAPANGHVRPSPAGSPRPLKQQQGAAYGPTTAYYSSSRPRTVSVSVSTLLSSTPHAMPSSAKYKTQPSTSTRAAEPGSSSRQERARARFRTAPPPWSAPLYMQKRLSREPTTTTTTTTG
eukprot:XP_020404354.1 uncharacterized protein LOC109944110 [Zea mays]